MVMALELLIFITSLNIHVHYGAEAQSFNPTLTFEEARHLQVADGTEIKYPVSCVTRFVDFNTDGHTDLLVASEGRIHYYLKLPSSDRYEGSRPVQHEDGSDIDLGGRGDRRTTFTLADMVGDEELDILMTDGNTIYLMENVGGNPPRFGSPSRLRDLESNRFDVIDYDGDGDLDIITGTWGGDFMVYLNDGFNNFEDGFVTSQFRPGAYMPIPRVVDINGDGRGEVFHSINWGYFRLVVEFRPDYYRTYQLTHEGNRDINIRQRYGEYHAPEIVDVDQDGIMDLVTSGTSGDVVFFRGMDPVHPSINKLNKVFQDYPNNLGPEMESNDTLYHHVYDEHRTLQMYVTNPVFDGPFKADIFNWYMTILPAYPQYFSRQEWSTPGMASHAAHVWTVALESSPDTTEHRQRIASLTNHQGWYRRILEDRGLIIVNNNKEPDWKIELIHEFLMMKDPIVYSCSSISQNDHLTGKLRKYPPVREGSVNIFAGAESGENQFPSDCQVCQEPGRDPVMMLFLSALAHEISHTELDIRLSRAYSHELFQRKYEIIRRATEGHVIWNTPVERGWNRGETQTHFRNQGWWDGSSDWDTTFRNHFRNGPGSHLNRNSIRPFTIDFFVTAPQEAYATLANQYFSDGKLMLDWAMERTEGGNPLCMDWFLLMAKYYALSTNTVPMFECDVNGNMDTYDVIIGRNADGWINELTFDFILGLPGPTDYFCDLDSEGFVQDCIAL